MCSSSLPSPLCAPLLSRLWMGRAGGKGRRARAPMSYAPLDHGCSFSNKGVREGIVAISGGALRILSVGDGGRSAAAAAGADDDEAFNSNRIDLRYTPRGICLLPA